jgi:hypothetical protein
MDAKTTITKTRTMSQELMQRVNRVATPVRTGRDAVQPPTPAPRDRRQPQS